MNTVLTTLIHISNIIVSLYSKAPLEVTLTVLHKGEIYYFFLTATAIVRRRYVSNVLLTLNFS